jgi:uncharacterized phage infection (PIP) family protein YhgE
MEMISEGKVSAEQVEQALSGMTTKGGLFFEGMERQSKTFNGVMSNVRDNFGKFVREIVGISDQGDIREGSLFASLKVGAEGLLRALEELRPKATAAVNAFISNKSAVIALAGALGGMLVLAIGAFVAAFGPAIAIMTAVAAAGAGVAYALTRIDDIARTLVPQLAAATAAVFVLNGGFVGLFATIAANPLGALAIAVLAVASGVVYLATQTDLLKTKEDFLRQAQDNVKTAQDQLKISTDQLAGARENLKDVELRLEGANLAMIRAQRNVIDVQRRYGESSFEAKEARHQLEQAEREAEKAITAGKDALVQADTAQQNFIANSKKLKEADDKVVETRNIHKTSWEQIRDSIGGAIGKLMEWNDAAMRFGIGVGGPSGIKLPKFADGGWVPQTGPAIVHAGEFVLSRDMLRGRDPIPSNVVERNQTNSVQIGPVYVRNESDIQSLSQRLDYMLRTSGSL